MPGLDRKGPEGEGPMTGRRMGRCTNFGDALKDKDTTDNPNAENQQTGWFGRGLGRGFGRGRGRGSGRGFGRGRG